MDIRPARPNGDYNKIVIGFTIMCLTISLIGNVSILEANEVLEDKDPIYYLSIEELIEERECNMETREAAPHGLYVDNQGRLMKGDKEYRGYGINYFSLFNSSLGTHASINYMIGLRTLSEYDIPFVRFAACGFWPANNDLYFENKDRYFALMDRVVRQAESLGIGLIPSLFWNSATVPDLMGEPRSAWGDVDSKTHEFMKTYIREVVTRYVDSPAIWGWEFGNEYNLKVDSPNPEKSRPAINTDLGTPPSRSELDDLTSDMIETALRVFAEEVRKYDPSRIILSGNGGNRPQAWNMMETQTWWPLDSEEKHKKMFLKHNPAPIDALSVHLYYNVFGVEAKVNQRFNVIDKEMTFGEYLEWLMEYSQELKMPLFVGEWGASEEMGHREAKRSFREKLDALEEAEVPISALWVFDLPNQTGTWNITRHNNRAYQLEALQEANLRLRDEE